MFGISFEHLVIFGIILMLFGPKRLPELGNTMGKAIRNFKDSVSGVEEASFRKVAEAPRSAPSAAGASDAHTHAHVTDAVVEKV
jgi:sec-independent protein translocase protein TatA